MTAATVPWFKITWTKLFLLIFFFFIFFWFIFQFFGQPTNKNPEKTSNQESNSAKKNIRQNTSLEFWNFFQKKSLNSEEIPVEKHYKNEIQESRSSLTPEDNENQTKSESPNAAFPEIWKTIRIATWDLEALNFDKIYHPLYREIILAVLNDFDIIAVQGIKSQNSLLLKGIEELLNKKGKNYSFVQSNFGVSGQENLAFLFNTGKIVADLRTQMEISDHSGRLTYPVFVLGFRAKEPDPDKAFTFRLINVKIDKTREKDNLDALYDIFRALRDHSPLLETEVLEDDLIMLGNFEADLNELQCLGAIADLVAVHPNLPTEIAGKKSFDHIFLDQRATVEYIHRYGIVPILQRFELSEEEGLNISGHLPVWAEFSIYEGN